MVESPAADNRTYQMASRLMDVQRRTSEPAHSTSYTQYLVSLTVCAA